MGIIIRQSIKGTIVSYIGALVGFVNIIFLYPYCLSPENIGLLRVFIEVGTFLAFFSQLGISNFTIKYYPHFKDASKKDNGFFIFLIVIPLIGFTIFSILYILLKNQVIQYFSKSSDFFSNYFYYILPLAFFLTFLGVFESFATVLSRIVIPKFIREIIIRILTGVIITLFFYHFFTIDGLLISYIGIYFVALLLIYFYINKLYKTNFTFNRNFFTKPLAKEMLLFITFILAAGFSNNIVNKIDVFMITSRINLANTGIFTIAFFIASFIEMPSRSIIQIAGPFASNAMKDNNWDKVDELYKKTSLNQLIIGSLIFILVLVNVDNIFKIMPNGDVFREGKYVIYLIGITKLFDAATSINAYILGYSKYYHYTLIFIFLLAALSIVTNMIFIPLYGINGAALATSISIFLYNALTVFFVYIKMKVQPFTINIIKVIGIILSMFLVHYLIPTFENPFLDSTIRSTVIIVLFIFLIIKFNISEYIKNIYNQIIKGEIIKNLFKH